MPTYDYECEKCGIRFEAFQSMTAERLKDCPEDGCEGPVRRLIGTGAGLIFKGSGFYETDYRSESYKAGAKSESGANSESKKSDSGANKESKGSKKNSSGSGEKS